MIRGFRGLYCLVRAGYQGMGRAKGGARDGVPGMVRDVRSYGTDENGSPLQLPPGSWCSHMHVSSKSYPLVPTAQYQLKHDHTVSDALKYYSRWNVENMVFVQPSIYGTDNSCLLDGLKAVTPDHGRGVVDFDPATITQEQLREWHGLGVRGVRVNFVSVGRQPSDSELAEILEAYAKAIRPLKTWELEVYIPLSLCDPLVKIVPTLNVKFAIAHCGNPSLPSRFAGPTDPYTLPGFQSLITLLSQGSTWVKLSGPYRLSHDEDQRAMRDLEPLVKELLDQAPHRVVWAGDWPHTRYEGSVNLDRWVEKCFELTSGKGEKERRERLFKRNSEELFDV